MVSALRQDDFLGLLPIKPMTVARYRAAFTPSRAKAAPTDAARPRALLRTHRDTLPPLQPQSPTRRARAQLVDPRRRVVGDTGRLTKRLPSTLKHYCPQGLQWLQEKAPLSFGDFLRRWPTLNAAPRARRAPLEPCFRDHHGRSAAVIDTRLHALKAAMPLTTDAGVSAPHALRVQPLVSQLRVAVHAIEDFDTASAQRAQNPPDFPFFQALPGAGPVFASRLLVACGEQRARSASAADLQQ
jgi:transposase